ncbi:capsule biosynthesis protein [Aestuariibius insulae]|uniref:capsule biosynthesis protein n=1 Tax=Aestuariibius insulae TaxID=2058287 RepID=UPI00345E9C79
MQSERKFLFLQGPHGPFFWRLSCMLRAAGAQVTRVGFNAGDRAFWHDAASYIAFKDRAEAWPERFDKIVDEREITDIVLYGDVRPIHAQAIEQARDRGLTIHVFEEGYLRPFWVTYERGGTNGYSRLMDMSVTDMRRALEKADPDDPPAPASWGDMRQHIFYGALYHTFVLFWNGAYANFQRHRELPVSAEVVLYGRRLLLMPFHALGRALSTARINRSGHPFHLVLMQLEHDASFLAHSRFTRMEEFLQVVIEGFSAGAPRHHHLVFKAHPLETGRSPHSKLIARIAAEQGVTGRVHYVRGGKLAGLLNNARSAVTVNSTAAQQVLRRGISLKVFGDAVYDKPEFVSEQPLADFFAQPKRPDRSAYTDYRLFLLETSQVPGGFYAARSRRPLLRQVVDMMLQPEDPYDALAAGTAAPRQQLRVVP